MFLLKSKELYHLDSFETFEFKFFEIFKKSASVVNWLSKEENLQHYRWCRPRSRICKSSYLLSYHSTLALDSWDLCRLTSTNFLNSDYWLESHSKQLPYFIQLRGLLHGKFPRNVWINVRCVGRLGKKTPFHPHGKQISWFKSLFKSWSIYRCFYVCPVVTGSSLQLHQKLPLKNAFSWTACIELLLCVIRSRLNLIKNENSETFSYRK